MQIHARRHTQEKYPQVVETLRSQILDGRLPRGSRLPTFGELQQQFGVTSQTVSRAFHELENQGLIVRHRGRGVFVAPMADVPRTERRGIIGLHGWSFTLASGSPYWSQLMEGIQTALDKADQQVLLVNQDISSAWAKCDGVLMCAGIDSLRLLPSNLPCVAVLQNTESISSVTTDDAGGAFEATKHLLQLGHKRIGVLYSHSPATLPVRLSGHHAALAAAKLKPHPRRVRLLQGSFDFGEDFVRAGYSAMKQWLAEDWKQLGCTALLAYNDETAWGAIRAFQEAGLSVPHDVSVVGFDGVTTNREPALTTIELPLRNTGATAAEMLLQRISDGHTQPEHKVLPVQLRTGKTTSAPAEQ
jgi:DNA-binding LacI/PurR family transcriptional regulator